MQPFADLGAHVILDSAPGVRQKVDSSVALRTRRSRPFIPKAWDPRGCEDGLWRKGQGRRG